MNSSRLQTTSDFCKSHSARSEREPCSPSKLSKKELEDQYYSLMETNMALKKLVNSQGSQAKLLATKVMRLTAATKNQGQASSCCAGVKAVVEEQKISIADLTLSNEKMSEKIKSLNMRLCSAKQFMKKSPLSRCLKCSRASLAKNTSSVSAIHTKRSDAYIQTTVSCQYYDNMDLLSPKSVKTEEIQKKENDFKDHGSNQCDDNRCRTEMESLRKHVLELKENLTSIQNEYEEKLTLLQAEHSRTQAENTRARAERLRDEQSAREREVAGRALAARLREGEARCNDVVMQLSLEKKRVVELETQLRSAQLSGQLAKTIEEHLSLEEQKRNHSPVRKQDVHRCFCSRSPRTTSTKPSMDDKSPEGISSKPIDYDESVKGCTKSPNYDKVNSAVDVTKESKLSDDSGFTDPYNKSADRNDEMTLDKINTDLISRIANLQTQLDELKITTLKQLEAKENGNAERKPNRRTFDDDQETLDNISHNSISKYSPLKSASTEINPEPKTSTNQKLKAAEKALKSSPKLKVIVREKVLRRLIVKDTSANKTDDKSLKLNLSNDVLPEAIPEYTKKYLEANTSIQEIPSELEDNNIQDAKEQTYSIKRSAAASPDNTEYEISDISESSVREPSGKLSLGERRPSTFSESYTTTTSGSAALSEGELPFGRKILSIGERPVLFKTVSSFANPQEPISKKIESTLDEISTELSRCTRLLKVRCLPTA